jgi:hypothetical protein
LFFALSFSPVISHLPIFAPNIYHFPPLLLKSIHSF